MYLFSPLHNVSLLFEGQKHELRIQQLSQVEPTQILQGRLRQKILQLIHK